jgi:predicted AAA+ superfamily ATPase
MILRNEHSSKIKMLLSSNPVVGIIGARQVGKTTLARQYIKKWNGPVHFFDLEDPRDEAKLADPMIALEGLQGLIILDEIQRTPGIFKVLRVLCDRDPLPARFLVLGSASPELLQQSAETLAGRISYLELGGLGLNEVGSRAMNKLWIRGGFPRSFLAETDEESAGWRRDFIKTFLERDLPAIGLRMPASTMRRFWTMMAHYHGQLWNASEIGRSFGVADTTVRRYLDTLEASLVVRVLQPWHENIGKRQVKAPKTYIADSGIAHALLELWNEDQVLGHPKMGATWEGFALKTIVEKLGAMPESCFFWRAHTGAELDLFVLKGGKRLGFEFKRTASPQVTRSMQNAAEALSLDRLFVIHAGAESFPMKKGIVAIPLSRIWTDPELSRY